MSPTGGTFHHIRAQGRDHERRAVTHIFARLGADATFKSFTLTANGVLTRNEAVITFTGDNATGRISRARRSATADFHHDDTVFVTHDAVACESRQVFKKVLRNGAVGVFQGKILVKPGAQKTDGYQISQALASRRGRAVSRQARTRDLRRRRGLFPRLDLGAIDETALFYLPLPGTAEVAGPGPSRCSPSSPRRSTRSRTRRSPPTS